MIRTLILLTLAGMLNAAEPTPRERILSLVPEETSVCFIVQNLRERATTVAKSPFAEWAARKIAPVLESNDDAKHLKSIESLFSTMLGVTLADLRDDILGDCIVFAYLPSANGKAERGVVMLHAREPKKLASLLDKLNTWQKQSKELAGIVPLKHNGQEYIKRDRGLNDTEYYLLHDNLFVFSKQEDALWAIIDRAVNSSDSKVLRDLDELKLQDAFLACWLNPRKIESELVPAADASATERAGTEQVAKLWRAVDQCAIYLKADDGLEIGTSMTYRAKSLPEEWRTLLGSAPVLSPLWSIVPKDAIFAAVGDLEINKMLKVFESFLPEPDRPKLRKQIEKQIGTIIGMKQVQPLLDGLGPEFGIWLCPTERSGAPLPAALVVAKSKSRDSMQVLEFYSQMLRYNYNSEHEDQIERQSSGEIAILTNDSLFPRKVTPSYTARDGYVLVSTDPAMIRRFQLPQTNREAIAEVPLSRLAVKSLREQLRIHSDELPKVLAKWQDREADEIGRELENLMNVLEAFDYAELVVRGDPHSRTFALKIQMVKSLK